MGFTLAGLLPQPATTDEGCQGTAVASGEGYKRILCLSRGPSSATPWALRLPGTCAPKPRPERPPSAPPPRADTMSGVPTPLLSRATQAADPRSRGEGPGLPEDLAGQKDLEPRLTTGPVSRPAAPPSCCLGVSQATGLEHFSLANSERLADESAGNDSGCVRPCPSCSEYFRSQNALLYEVRGQRALQGASGV